jgi:hypothetical protein
MILRSFLRTSMERELQLACQDDSGLQPNDVKHCEGPIPVDDESAILPTEQVEPVVSSVHQIDGSHVQSSAHNDDQPASFASNLSRVPFRGNNSESIFLGYARVK